MRRALAAIVILLVLVSPAAAAGILELRVAISSPSSGQRADQPARAITLRHQAAHPGTLRRERRPELGPDRLVILVLDGNGAQLDWRSIADPRIVRIEAADANGLLSGQRVIDSTAEFTLRIPDLPGAARVVIYSTETTDTGYALAQLGEFALTR